MGKDLRASFLRKAFDYLGAYKLGFLRKIYWDILAREIDQRYGDLKHDYDTLTAIITSVAPQRLLDIGCGSGRLVSLYQTLGVKEVVGQDIAQSAIDLARSRYQTQNIRFLNVSIEELDFPELYFDMVICNRVLQHIHPEYIEAAINKICRLGKYVYINEASDKDFDPRVSSWLYKHNYVEFLEKCGFAIKAEGTIVSEVNSQQKWIFFGFSPERMQA